MKTPEKPTIVPLPELANYTDDVVVHSLGLPQDFDKSRLGVNLTAFSRVQTLSGLGRINIMAISGSSGGSLSDVSRASGIDAMYTPRIDATVVLQEDNTDRQLRIQGSLAGALNSGVRNGLHISNLRANADIFRAGMSAVMYGGGGAAAFASYEGATAIGATLLVSQLGNIVLASERRGGMLNALKNVRKSLFFGLALDRAAAGAAAIASSRFIVARETT